jgi:hypothetical protein
MRPETRHEALQRGLTRAPIQSHVYWRALITVNLATGYREFAPILLRVLEGATGPVWAAEWVLHMFGNHDAERWEPVPEWN